MNRTIPVEILNLFICPEHHFRGHEKGRPGDAETVDVDEVRCVAGRGIEGDRYFHQEPGGKRQITFFDLAVFDGLREAMGTPGLERIALRRNVVLSGVDLNDLIDRAFTIGDVEFFGVEECAPCFWMNDVCAAGAEDWLRGRGGLRARILSDGTLAKGPATLTLG